MTREEVAEDVKSVVGEMVGATPEQVTEDKSLATDLDLDSLLRVEMFVVLDAHFEIVSPNQELAEKAELVSDVVSYVEQSLSLSS